MYENNSHKNNQQAVSKLADEADLKKGKFKTKVCFRRCFNGLKIKLALLLLHIKNMSKRNKNVVVVVVVGTLIIVGIALVVIVSSNHVVKNGTSSEIQRNAQQQRLAQLNNIESRLGVLTSELNQNNTPSTQQLDQIAVKINRIQNAVGNLATQSGVDHLSNVVKSGNQDLSGKVSNLLILVQQIKKQITPVAYLKSSVLPFKPVSVDIWNGVSYATVKLDGHSALMGKNETRDGWTVESLDYDAQKVIFKNHKKQFVRVYIEN